MADNRISDLPSTAALTLSDLLEVEQPAQAAGTRSRKTTLSQLLALIFDDDPTLAGDSDDKAATQAAVKAFVTDAIADAIAGLAPAAASVGVQFTADTSSTSDADPGAGKLRWNHATQGSATVVYLDDASADGASLTAIWPRLNAGGVMFLQHATDQDVWQIWEFTAINDASGYAKLTVTLWGAAGSFANGDPILVTLDKGQPAPTGMTIKVTTTVTSNTITPAGDTDTVRPPTLTAGLTIANPASTPQDGWPIVLELKDNGTSRTLTWGSKYASRVGTLPTATTAGKQHVIVVSYNTTDDKLYCDVASVQA